MSTIEVLRFIYWNFPNDEVLDNEKFFEWVRKINKEKKDG